MHERCRHVKTYPAQRGEKNTSWHFASTNKVVWWPLVRLPGRVIPWTKAKLVLFCFIKKKKHKNNACPTVTHTELWIRQPTLLKQTSHHTFKKHGLPIMFYCAFSLVVTQAAISASRITLNARSFVPRLTSFSRKLPRPLASEHCEENKCKFLQSLDPGNKATL